MKAERRGALVFVGVLVFSAVLGSIYGSPVRATAAGTNDLQDSIKSLTRVLSVVQQNYAIPIDSDHALYDGAIPGMLRVLDPHSTFFDPREYALLREDQRGKYYGVGMTVGPQNNHTVVLAPMPGSPAAKAGIRPGDIIARVENKATDGLTVSEVADLLKGPKGTVVHVTMVREGYDQPITLAVTRDEIPKHSVDVAFVVRPGIGYVRLSAFNEETDTELAAALKQIDVAKPRRIGPRPEGKSGRVAERSGSGLGHVPGQEPTDRFAPRPSFAGAALLRGARQSRRPGSDRGARERRIGIGLGDRDRLDSGS